MKTISVGKAILAGYLFVNIPVGILIAGQIFFVAKFVPHPGPWWIASFPAGFLCAWFWWSIAMPKWRLWAYERVEDIGGLKQSAIDAQLTWPEGSFFQRSEIKSASHAEREKALESAWLAQQAAATDRPQAGSG